MPTDNLQNRPFSPDYIVPPGETLAEILEERTLTQTELARRLGLSLKHTNQIINGVASISAEVALGLEKVLGVSAAFWLNRDALFQAELARQEEQQDFGKDVGWAQQFPISELKKRGLLSNKAKGSELVAELLRFLGLASPRQWADPIASFRKSMRFESDPYALSAWLRVGELEARQIRCEPFDAERFAETLHEIRSLTRMKPEQWEPQLTRLCGDAGVAVVIVDTFSKARVNGAARWLAPHRAIIQLSLRYRWEDIFWFSFFHEAAHILLHRKKELFVEPKARPGATSPAAEQWLRVEHEADRFASRVLIPPPYDRQVARLSLTDVSAFARRLDVAPAIVVGRMQYERVVPYSAGNHMRRRLQFVD
jgi:HTH-type transcriptional regulator/antitoxin HigA